MNTRKKAAGERVLHRGSLHGVIYAGPIAASVAGLVWTIISFVGGTNPDGGLALFTLGALFLIRASIKQSTTEIAVTTHRFVVKRGLLRHLVMEIGAGQIESVAVRQSIGGRLFDYGTVVVSGTGSHLDPVETVAEPLALRRALDSLYRPPH